MSKFYICTTFDGHYPIGTAAVVRAENEDEAAMALTAKLADVGLPQIVEPWQLTCISDAAEDGAIILCDGNY